MPADPENPVPAPSAGLIDRLSAFFGKPKEEPNDTAEPSALEAELATVKAERDALVEAGTQAADKLESLTSQLSEVQGNLTKATATLDAVNAVIPKTSDAANISEHIAAHVQAATADAIASAGFKPNDAPAVDDADRGDGTMSRADFSKLSAAKQSEFCTKGGKITE